MPDYMDNLRAVGALAKNAVGGLADVGTDVIRGALPYVGAALRTIPAATAAGQGNPGLAAHITQQQRYRDIQGQEHQIQMHQLRQRQAIARSLAQRGFDPRDPDHVQVAFGEFMAVNDLEAAEAVANAYKTFATSRKAPTTRKVMRGAEQVAEEWNPRTGAWDQVGVGDPPALVSIGADPIVKARADQLSRAEQETGDADLARAFVGGGAFREPLFGRIVYGGDVDRREASKKADALASMRDLEAAAEAVAREYGNTSRFAEIAAQAEQGFSGSTDPALEAFMAKRNESISARVKALGGNPSDRDLRFIDATVPTLAELVREGSLSESARRKFDQAWTTTQDSYGRIFQARERAGIDWGGSPIQRGFAPAAATPQDPDIPPGSTQVGPGMWEAPDGSLWRED